MLQLYTLHPKTYLMRDSFKRGKRIGQKIFGGESPCVNHVFVSNLIEKALIVDKPKFCDYVIIARGDKQTAVMWLEVNPIQDRHGEY